MKITKRWLEDKGTCPDGIAWFTAQTETDGGAIVRKLMAEYPKNGNGLTWANWLIVRILPRKKMIRYAIFAAEQVIEIFEAEYPDDKRPREAIEAAKAVLKRNTAKNRAAAYAAAEAAADAAADAADAAAEAAAYAAEAAAYVTAYAVAYAARAAAEAAAYATAYATAYAARALKEKIIRYGLLLLEVK